MAEGGCRSIGTELDEHLVETLKPRQEALVSEPEQVRVQLCGRFAFVVGGRAVHAGLPGRRGRLLLAYLAAHRDRPVQRGQLLDALWGDAGGSAAATLSVVLSKVRSLIAPARIDGRSTVQLVLPEGSIVDLDTAVTALHEAQSANALRDWRRAWTAGLTAQMVARRGFLTEYDEAWVEPLRARLDLVYEQALACYAEACLGIGGTEVPAAERAARRLVEHAPLSETGYRLLMEALAARGDTAAALAVYEQLRRTVRDELGVDPGPAARQLHDRLLHAATDG
jgi:SARP family transcriptional regulator, regulator of embCAB operon